MGFIIVGVVIFLSLIGVLIWWIATRNRYRFNFRVWSKDLKSSYIVRAKISIDKENKNSRLFTFTNNPSELIMKDPVHWDKGKPERWVIADESGAYQYISPDKLVPIDDVDYIRTRLHPIDKQLALEGMRNGQKRYEHTDKVGIIAFISLIVLCAILILGMIYGLGVITKNANSVGDNSRILKDMQMGHDSNTIQILESMKEVTNNLAYIYGQISGNNTIVRPVTGFQP